MQQLISLPENIKKGDDLYFKPHLQWRYQDPVLNKRIARVLISNGLVLTPLFTHDTIISPWKTYYQGHKKSYFIGQIFKRLTKTSVVKSKNLYIVCNTFSNNFFHWITEVLP